MAPNACKWDAQPAVLALETPSASRFIYPKLLQRAATERRDWHFRLRREMHPVGRHTRM